jgi:hypothetical protein
VLVRRESLRGDSTDTLGRRIGRLQFGVLAFELDELAQERVELRIGYLRIVERVIAVVGLFDLRAQLIRPSGSASHPA